MHWGDTQLPQCDSIPATVNGNTLFNLLRMVVAEGVHCAYPSVACFSYGSINNFPNEK